MRLFNHGSRARSPRMALLLGIALLPLGACDTLLEVDVPDIITPENLAGPTGVNAFYAGAVGDFAVAYTGGAGGGSFLDGLVTTTAYFSDEGYAAGTFPTRQEFDQRSVDENNGTLFNVFSRLQRARRATEVAAALISDADPSDTRAAELLALAGLTYVGLGEAFCSGVPFSDAPLGGELEFGGPLTTVEIFQRGAERAQSAEAAAGGDAEIENLAKVVRGRALLNAGDFAAAAQAVAGVPTEFLYVTTHSLADSRIENGLNSANEQTKRLSIANDEGGSGPPFAEDPTTDGEGLSYLMADDPRIPWFRLAGAFDATVPQTYVLSGWPQFGIDLGRSAPFPVASGIEARLIEAEADLQVGGAETVSILNELRSGSTVSLPPLADPGTAEGRRDLLFRERAFWLFFTGHRMGDLRRLVRQYGLPQEEVFPTGAYFKGGSFGADVNLPIPQEEQNNPEFTQCLNRNA